MNTNTLEILIGGRHAASIEIHGEQAERVDRAEHWQDISIAWSEPPDRRRLELWLDACLPENGSREPYGARCALKLIEHGLSARPWEPAAMVWASPDDEYPGAVGFASMCTQPRKTQYRAATDADIADRLYEAWTVANKAHKGRPRERPERRTSLSGMRGKTGIAWVHGRWHTAHGAALTNWIAKHEDSTRLRGEAGIESLCQKAMGLLGVPCAHTISRVFGEHQCVLSRRADRTHDAAGAIVAVHQEDFAQATSWPSGQKYDAGSRAEPRWEAAYALLRAHGIDPQTEAHKLTRMLAATWTLGHCDLHRRNFGFTHESTEHGRKVRLAPMYDVSSAVGTHLDQELAIGIARQARLSGIGPRQWLAHARQCNIDPEHTLAIVRETVRDTPEALAAAREAVRESDENRYQSSVDRRAEAMIGYAEKRRRVFNEHDRRLNRLPVPAPELPRRDLDWQRLQEEQPWPQYWFREGEEGLTLLVRESSQKPERIAGQGLTLDALVRLERELRGWPEESEGAIRAFTVQQMQRERARAR